MEGKRWQEQSDRGENARVDSFPEVLEHAVPESERRGLIVLQIEEESNAGQVQKNSQIEESQAQIAGMEERAPEYQIGHQVGRLEVAETGRTAHAHAAPRLRQEVGSHFAVEARAIGFLGLLGDWGLGGHPALN